VLPLGREQVVEHPEQAEDLDLHSVLFPELADHAVFQALAEFEPATRELPRASLVTRRGAALGQEEPRAGRPHHGADADADVVTARYRRHSLRHVI
jgi:hypothetical protein